MKQILFLLLIVNVACSEQRIRESGYQEKETLSLEETLTLWISGQLNETELVIQLPETISLQTKSGQSVFSVSKVDFDRIYSWANDYFDCKEVNNYSVCRQTNDTSEYTEFSRVEFILHPWDEREIIFVR